MLEFTVLYQIETHRVNLSVQDISPNFIAIRREVRVEYIIKQNRTV